ncbi:MAG: 2-oxoacid:acceptor oxidoreductase family protein [Anaerolineae bacterium]|nr:2-oxoacid:acceptor oxidoreductase family protein [Anaerolineae bacterium]MDW8068940.1 2-oxoacid:acceptor oxidoreductase family protein [Anaerolineae bacterium]
MQEEILISGFGGQGTLFAGQMLAYAAMDAGFHVTWIPSYGPEIRGGRSRCTVIISDQEIGSPLVRHPSAAIVMSIPSMEAFEPAVRPGGVLVVNASLIPMRSQRPDLRVLYVPALEMAMELGSTRVANMICLGALVQAMSILPLETIEQAMDRYLGEPHRQWLSLNKEALRRGASLAMQ